MWPSIDSPDETRAGTHNETTRLLLPYLCSLSVLSQRTRGSSFRSNILFYYSLLRIFPTPSLPHCIYLLLSPACFASISFLSFSAFFSAFSTLREIFFSTVESSTTLSLSTSSDPSSPSEAAAAEVGMGEEAILLWSERAKAKGQVVLKRGAVTMEGARRVWVVGVSTW